MSSILKALKKVENEAQPQDEFPPSPGRVDTKGVIQNRAKGRLPLYRLSLVLAVGIILVLGGWIFWNDKPPSPEGPAPAAEAAKGSKKEVKVSSLPSRKNPPGAPAEAGEKRPAAVRPVPTVGEKSQRPLPVTVKPSSPAAPEKTKAASRSYRVPKAAKEETRGESMDISRFKLEAIVWSSNPESRFAVINGRIVRAGGPIEDVSVREIGRDFVTLGSGEGEGKLRFSLEE